MTDIDQFITGLPKAELHLHIEGTLEPELMFALARRNDVTLPYGSIDEIRQAYDFGNLQDFLDIYYAGTNVLRTPQDFHDLAAAYFDRAAQDNIVHAEIMFDPQAHTSRGVPFADVIEGLLSAMRNAEERHGITSDLILSFLRHLSEEEAFETLRAATPWLPQIKAVGLDSSEVGHPPEKFARVFAAAARSAAAFARVSASWKKPVAFFFALSRIRCSSCLAGSGPSSGRVRCPLSSVSNPPHLTALSRMQ